MHRSFHVMETSIWYDPMGVGGITNPLIEEEEHHWLAVPAVIFQAKWAMKSKGQNFFVDLEISPPKIICVPVIPLAGLARDSDLV